MMYQILEDGSVWNGKRFLSPFTIGKGYLAIRIKKTNLAVHRLVGMCFKRGYSSERNQINHLDGNKHNNHYTNLTWVTAAENNLHAYAIGLKKPTLKQKLAARRTGIRRRKLNEKQVRIIRQLYEMGLSTYKISDRFPVSQPSVLKIVNGESYCEVL